MGENRRAYRRAFRQMVQENLPDAEVQQQDGMRLLKYETDGEFNYDLYKDLQTLGNKFKLHKQWVPEEHIEILSNYVNQAGVTVERGVCHGTRQGNEQMWFRDHLSGDADVFGTEISDTADQFPHTIQWDFHETKPEWVKNFGLVYSNSWDHAFDPARAFRGWVSCLKPGGIMLLDHGWNYRAEQVNALDPFGISEQKLIELLEQECGDAGRVVETIDGGTHKRFPIRTVVFQANGS